MAIISVSGPKGGGKDTVGKIIQSLISAHKYPKGIVDVHESVLRATENNTALSSSGWHIKGFATALKKVASILTGVPIEKWEDQEFKKSYMGEEWNKWCVKWVDNKTKKPEQAFFTNYGEADRYYTILNNTPVKYLATNRQSPLKVPITYRQFLQWLGTEGVREGIHANTWVNALMSEYKPIKHIALEKRNLANNYYHTACDKCSKPYSGYKRERWCNDCISKYTDYPNWIITDTRFENELQAVKDRDGICIKVDRKSVETGDTHPSETEWRNWEFDYVIDNDGTIEELVVKVKEMLLHFKIIQ